MSDSPVRKRGKWATYWRTQPISPGEFCNAIREVLGLGPLPAPVSR